MPPVSSQRILVVDDNKDAAATLAMLLKIMGHSTQVAHDGLDAYQLVESWLPNVVLLDLGLPKLDGLEVCRRIRQQPWGKDMVLIALTGWARDEDKSKSQAAGFNHHLVKPVDAKELGKLLSA